MFQNQIFQVKCFSLEIFEIFEIFQTCPARHKSECISVFGRIYCSMIDNKVSALRRSTGTKNPTLS